MTPHEYPSSECGVFPCRRNDGRTDITMLIVAFRNFRTPLKFNLIGTLSLSMCSVHTCRGGRFLWYVIAILWDTKHRILKQKVLILRFMCYAYFINHLKNDLHLHYERKVISFLTQNTVHLYTKLESVNHVYLIKYISL